MGVAWCVFTCVCVHCRVELSLQQNEIMNLFVDDYKNLPDTNWITGNKSDSSLNVSVPLPHTSGSCWSTLWPVPFHRSTSHLPTGSSVRTR